MIYITGDCHGEFKKFSNSSFPEQKQMTKKDVVIICGDFGGIWDTDKDSPHENHWLKWLNEKSFTTVFVDGNHENFNRLNNDFDTVEFCGGKVHKIRDSIFHLKRGEVYEIEGKKFFAFGGANSHDINDGILDRDDFESDYKFKETIRRWRKKGKEFRVKNVSWWEEELPSEDEFRYAADMLNKYSHNVDFVITHCAPQSIAEKLYHAPMRSDDLTIYFDKLLEKLDFRYWFFGHYHEDKKIDDRFILLYDQIIRIR